MSLNTTLTPGVAGARKQAYNMESKGVTRKVKRVFQTMASVEERLTWYVRGKEFNGRLSLSSSFGDGLK